MKKSYLEHVHITVQSLDEAIKFLQTAMPDFKVRKRFLVSGSRSEWVHIGTEDSYLTLVEMLPPEKMEKAFSKVDFEANKSNRRLHKREYFKKFKAKKNKLERPDQYKVGLNHLGFVVSDLEGLVDRLRKAGYQGGINDGKIMSHSSFKQSYFLSSEGNIEFEFVEYLVEDTSLRNEYVNVTSVEEVF